MEWKCKQMAYDTGDVIYAGYHVDAKPSDDDPNWLIYKYTYTSTDLTKIQKIQGTWTGRASLF
jgi:hypothetical protein